MQDDVTRGAYAPIEADGSFWRREDGARRRGEAEQAERVRVGLTAVVLSVEREQPVVLVKGSGHPDLAPERDAAAPAELPTGGFWPHAHGSLEAALRDEVKCATGCELGYVEQLLTDYSPGDTPHDGSPGDGSSQVSVSYLALTRTGAAPLAGGAQWVNCYDLLPWEDFRGGRPNILASHILPGLEAWAGSVDQTGGQIGAVSGADLSASRTERVQMAFGSGSNPWDDERVVDRFDLIQEAATELPSPLQKLAEPHLRLVAAGLGRLRNKLRYRPVVFEVLPAEFTLFELQRTVEAVLGPTLHKQNFRRLVEGTGLVEPTGDVRTNTGGRPAKTFRFRREVLLERPAPGVHVRSGRAA